MTGGANLQGTNALVILEAFGPAAHGDRKLTWRRRRFWAAPFAHAMLRRISVPRQRTVVILEPQLSGAANVCMLDHRCA